MKARADRVSVTEETRILHLQRVVAGGVDFVGVVQKESIDAEFAGHQAESAANNRGPSNDAAISVGNTGGRRGRIDGDVDRYVRAERLVVVGGTEFYRFLALVHHPEGNEYWLADCECFLIQVELAHDLCSGRDGTEKNQTRGQRANFHAAIVPKG